ncbi:hypothetical protein G6F25_014104 [Rhizopus arrhizus]|nr:hypothetical protein G6F25_014104 [Rhizopus arrhizus]
MAYLNGHIALANANMNASYRPTLIDFHGYEGEDFRHFLEILESYFALNNIALDARKLTILKAQLRGAAKVYILGIAALTLDYVPNSTGHRVNKVSTVLWSC